MNRNMLIGMSAVIAVLFSILLMQEDRQGPAVSAELLPGLKPVLNEITEVTLTKNGETTTLRNESGIWVVAERNGYPADFEQLGPLMNDLAAAKIIEKKTARPENHARLELDEANATLVEAVAGDASFGVMIGKTASQGEGLFVRRKGEDQVWLVDKTPDVPDTMLAWLQPVITNVEAQRVQRVTLFDETGNQVIQVEVQDGEDNMVLVNKPADQALRYSTVANQFRQSLVNPRLQDVAAHDQARFEGARRATFELDDESVVEVRAVKQDENHWIHLTGIDDLGAYDYQVAEYVYDDFVKELADLLEEPAEEGDDEGSDT